VAAAPGIDSPAAPRQESGGAPGHSTPNGSTKQDASQATPVVSTDVQSETTESAPGEDVQSDPQTTEPSPAPEAPVEDTQEQAGPQAETDAQSASPKPGKDKKSAD
jgi:hypothetical protein